MKEKHGGTSRAQPASTVAAQADVPQGMWSEAAVRVLRERYLLRDASGAVVETPDALCWRVARAVASAEARWAGDAAAGEERVAEIAAQFAAMMVERKFLPNSPTLMNAGKGNNLQLSACYVVPVQDSLPGIFDAVKHAALIHQSGGGTGFSFSRLRPEGSMVASTHGVASGPVSFMRIFDGATEAVKQGGTRRGANMGILRVDHPDIFRFIDCKRDGSVTNFNISVAITDEFMHALDTDGEYDLIDPHTGTATRSVRAREVMDRIVDAAWATGDPGLVFLDRANRSPANPTPEIELLEATNPCGEQYLGPYDACNLGSINLGLFVRDGAILWDELEQTTRTATRFLDDVIEINPFPLPEVSEKVHSNRRIGLGVMGWAEMLFELGLRYDSEEATALGERVMVAIQDWATDESARLAEDRGAFPNFARSIYKDGPPLRNSTRTTVAPTGSISILAECSSGIEPIFALAYQHRVKQPDGSYRVLDFVNPFFQRALEHSDIAEKAEVLEYVKAHGSLHGHPAERHPALAPYVTAHEIAPEWHIRMQAAFQNGVNNSISKTINVPNSATREDVENAYKLAWDLGCLGITVFRDGCKGEQVLNVGVKHEEPKASAPATAAPATATAVTATAVEAALPAEVMSSQAEQLAPVAPERASSTAPLASQSNKPYINGVKERPEVVAGYTRKVRAPEGKVYVTLNSDEDGLLEVFLTIGKAGSDVAALADALGRLISLHLRIDSPLSQDERAAEVARQLRSIGGSSSIGFGIDRVRSLPDAVARAIELHLAGTPTAALPPALDTFGGSTGPSPSDASQTEHGVGGAANHHANGFAATAPGIDPRTMAPYVAIGNLCSQCGNNTLYFEEGCKKCVSCGYSEC